MAVIAHEMGHIHFRDSYNSILRSIGRQVLLSVLTGGNSDLIAELINQLLQTKYSRGIEGRAVDFAINLLETRGIDPVYLALFFEQFEKLNTGDSNSVSQQYLATHPAVEKRIKNAREASRQFTGKGTSISFQWELIKKEQPSFFEQN